MHYAGMLPGIFLRPRADRDIVNVECSASIYP
jgi:hypothetical protein